MLRSLTKNTIWEGPSITADHRPKLDNENGIYALKREDGYEYDPTVRFRLFDWNYRTGSLVWGQVALSGVVVEGTMGYRAERSTIRSLYIQPQLCTLLPDVVPLSLICLWEDRYQCPVVFISGPILRV